MSAEGQCAYWDAPHRLSAGQRADVDAAHGYNRVEVANQHEIGVEIVDPDECRDREIAGWNYYKIDEEGD